MFEKYSERTRRAILFSRREAGKSGATAIDTVHLLLALVREDDTIQILTGVPHLSARINAQLEASLREQHRVPESVDLPISADYQEALFQASDEARILNSAMIEPSHLLLAILQLKDTRAATILMNMGLTYDSVREAIADEPDSGHG